MNLPNYKKIKIRNGCDRFGFSYLIAKELGYFYAPRSFCIWDHGWQFYPNSLRNNYVQYDRNIKVVVANREDKLQLRELGYKNIVVGGLPFSYVPRQNVKCIKDSLLVFIKHSTKTHYYDDKTLIDYLAYLSTLRDDYSYIYVSLFYDDYNSAKKELVKQNNLIPISGARSDDKYSLIRVRQMLEYCPMVTSNSLGSHIAYALYVGCRVSLTGNIIYRRLFKEWAIFEKQYGWLICDHPKKGIVNKSIGSEFIGSKNKLGEIQLKETLGWSKSEQMQGYYNAIKRKVISSIQR
jgi:hypothetical protein|tara:strand:+ start:3129 stop:4007 length:879 start_codon:yes stop_codon:yes gene_type:complete